jgi:hypothetical protein
MHSLSIKHISKSSKILKIISGCTSRHSMFAHKIREKDIFVFSVKKDNFRCSIIVLHQACHKYVFFHTGNLFDFFNILNQI